MKATLTIETAIAQQLRALMRNQKITLEEAVNEALRAGIPQLEKRATGRKSFAVVPFSMGLRPGINPDRISQHADEMFDADKLQKSLS